MSTTKTDLNIQWIRVNEELKHTLSNKPTDYLEKVVRPLAIGIKTLSLGYLSARVASTAIGEGDDDTTIDNFAHNLYAAIKIPEGIIKTIDGILLLIPRLILPFESAWKTRLAVGIPAAALFFAKNPQIITSFF